MEDSASRSRFTTTAALTAAAMVAFGANSLLCRAALQHGDVDPYSFTAIRLASGALTLAPLVAIHRRRQAAAGAVAERRSRRTDLAAAVLLILYAIPFAWAYSHIATGTGALILFAAVQTTLVAAGAWLGERRRPIAWIGMTLAFVGLLILVAPRVEAPPLSGALAMIVAGVCWGFYTLRGRELENPVVSNARAFQLATPIAIAAAALSWSGLHATPRGVVLAIASGAIATGLGYVIWYRALRGGLSATGAAVVQIAVPVIAAAGGIAFLGEPFHPRLVVAGVVILTGTLLAMSPPPRTPIGQPLAPVARDTYAEEERATCASQIARTRSKVSASAAVLSGR